MNPFRLLEIAPDWELDLKILDKQYFKKQRTFHPDRVIEADQKAIIEQQAIACNIAYTDLKNPFRRAKAILEYYEYPLDQQQPDQEFLMDFFHDLEHQEANPDFIKNRKTRIWEHLTRAFGANNLQQAAYYLRQWQYLEKY